MTDFSGANKALRDSSPEKKINNGDVYGKVRSAFDKFDLAVEGDGTLLETADTIKLVKIPKGSRVVGLEINSTDLGGTGTMNIGWAASAELNSSGSPVEVADPDGFAAADGGFSGAAYHFRLGNDVDAAGINKIFDAEVELTLIPAANFSATSGLIEVVLHYVVE
jgi:hypothetical protein